MRKLICLLLILLLPCTAMAEAWHASTQVEVNEDCLVALLTPLMPDDESKNEVSAIAGILDGSELDIVVQQDGLSAAVMFGGKKLLDFTAFIRDEQMLITSGLFRGYALSIPMSSHENQLESRSAALLAAIVNAVEGLDNAQLEIEQNDQAGVFTGDAYHDGAYCQTIVIEDKDIAQMISSILTDDVRAAVSAFFAELDLGSESFFTELDELNEHAAANNVHRYIIRLVEDHEHDPLGLSVTILRGDEQIATLSVGLSGTVMHIVAGMGAAEENLWYDHLIVADSEAVDLHLGGTCRQFTGAKDEDYAYAAAIMEQPVSLLNWALQMEATDDVFRWHYQHEAGGSVYPFAETVVCTGSRDAVTGAISSTLSVKADGNDISNVRFEMSRTAEQITAPDGNLTVCDLGSTEDEQLYLQSEITDLAMQMLTLRLMTILPLDLMMMP